MSIHQLLKRKNKYLMRKQVISVFKEKISNVTKQKLRILQKRSPLLSYKSKNPDFSGLFSSMRRIILQKQRFLKKYFHIQQQYWKELFC